MSPLPWKTASDRALGRDDGHHRHPDAVEAGDVGDPGDSIGRGAAVRPGQAILPPGRGGRGPCAPRSTGLRRCDCPGRVFQWAASSCRWRRARLLASRRSGASNLSAEAGGDLRQQVARAVRYMAPGAATGARGSWPRAAQGRSIPVAGEVQAPRQSKPPPRRGARRDPAAPRRDADAARAARSARRAPPISAMARSISSRAAPGSFGRDQHLG